MGVVHPAQPRSIQHSDTDGTGDLPALTPRLDHPAGFDLDALR
jgi:hypothetical protein